MSAFTERWNWPSLPGNLTMPELVVRLNERMRALDRILNLYANDLEHGPIPGAYAFIDLGRTDSAGLVAGIQDLTPISFDAVPVAVYAFADFTGGPGQVTFQVNNGGSNTILATGAVLSTFLTLNAASDFSVNRVGTPDLNLEILSVDSGTPVHIRVLVVLQNVTRVEDQ